MEQKFYICEHCGNIVAMVKKRRGSGDVLRAENDRDRSRYPPMPLWRNTSPCIR